MKYTYQVYTHFIVLQHNIKTMKIIFILFYSFHFHFHADVTRSMSRQMLTSRKSI